MVRTSKLVNSKKAAEERRKAEEKAALRGKEGKKGKLGKMSSMEVQLKTRTKELFQMKFRSNVRNVRDSEGCDAVPPLMTFPQSPHIRVRPQVVTSIILIALHWMISSRSDALISHARAQVT